MVDFYFEFDAFNQVIEINFISTVIYISLENLLVEHDFERDK